MGNYVDHSRGQDPAARKKHFKLSARQQDGTCVNFAAVQKLNKQHLRRTRTTELSFCPARVPGSSGKCSPVRCAGIFSYAATVVVAAIDRSPYFLVPPPSLLAQHVILPTSPGIHQLGLRVSSSDSDLSVSVYVLVHSSIE